jgi:hypothetical protein
MKRSFLITITIVFVFLITGCATNPETRFFYEDETYLQLSDGTMKIKVDEPILEEGTGENGVLYLRVQSSNRSLSCACNSGPGCTIDINDVGATCIHGACTARHACWGTIGLAPDSVKWKPYQKDRKRKVACALPGLDKVTRR